MTLDIPDATTWRQQCAEDGEFMLAARHWNGGLEIRIGTRSLVLAVAGGQPSVGEPDASGTIRIEGDASVWSKVLTEVPERFHNDLMANISQGQGLQRHADPVVFAQYFAAAARAIELLRPEHHPGELMVHDNPPTGTIDAPVGRYVHVQAGGHDHRIYFEEAGQGIPLLLQHTAGCHSSQWRHLFECREITERFRLIAYDLPCHGKSIPPVGQNWWAQQYQLKGEFLRAIPLALSEALGLQNPVFMGCSVGGLLALDLAHKHPDAFRAVVSIEGSLKIEGRLSDLGELWHPKVSNEYKARLMDGLMSPASPIAYRKETGFVYASGWPPVFLGDLYYYIEEYDLREQAGEIDTSRVAVHILSGEYDYSGTSEMGRQAHEAIPGSTWREMKGVGHFPMSENPAVFLEYLKPILDKIS